MTRSNMLSTTDHSRDAAGLTYVYPVISRRSGGLSIGINLNPNNACNWHCVYCQVPDLKRGSAPVVDLARLQEELNGFLHSVVDGSFCRQFGVAPENGVIRDIAISGNGEPTSAPNFDQVTAVIHQVLRGLDLVSVKRVLISNGSLMRRSLVQRGLRIWRSMGGEVWFKLDSGTEAGRRRINGVNLATGVLLGNLEAAAGICPTWIQTCVFSFDGAVPSSAERSAYLSLLGKARMAGIPLEGVLLYGLARPSMQAEAPRLAVLPSGWLEGFAAEIRRLGYNVKVSL